MNITQAQAVIDQAYEMGLINGTQAIWRSEMIRRKERYGGKPMFWAEAARMRANLLDDLPAVITEANQEVSA